VELHDRLNLPGVASDLTAAIGAPVEARVEWVAVVAVRGRPHRRQQGHLIADERDADNPVVTTEPTPAIHPDMMPEFSASPPRLLHAAQPSD
jgi:hypothetical protein